MAEPTPQDERELDETIEETFPASDPPTHTGETGIRVGHPPASAHPAVSDNRGAQRFELTVDGLTAFLIYERSADTLRLVHTEVPEALRGRRYGETLVQAGVEAARAAGLRLVVVCPFARAYLQRHPPAA